MSTPKIPSRLAELIPALEQTTTEISLLLESVADDQDWRPKDEHWSFRHIAAHLEACQTECVLVRVRQIAAGAKPTFEFYDNDGWDFSDRELRHSLVDWRESRARLFEFVRSLSPELTTAGTSATVSSVIRLWIGARVGLAYSSSCDRCRRSGFHGRGVIARSVRSPCSITSRWIWTMTARI